MFQLLYVHLTVVLANKDFYNIYVILFLFLLSLVIIETYIKISTYYIDCHVIVELSLQRTRTNYADCTRWLKIMVAAGYVLAVYALIVLNRYYYIYFMGVYI